MEAIHVPMWLTGTPSLRMYCTTSICPPSTAQCRAENPVWRKKCIDSDIPKKYIVPFPVHIPN